MCPVVHCQPQEASPVPSLPVGGDEHCEASFWGHMSPLLVVAGSPCCGGQVLSVGCGGNFCTFKVSVPCPCRVQLSNPPECTAWHEEWESPLKSTYMGMSLTWHLHTKTLLTSLGPSLLADSSLREHFTYPSPLLFLLGGNRYCCDFQERSYLDLHHSPTQSPPTL